MDVNKKTFNLTTGVKLILCVLFASLIVMKLFKKVDVIVYSDTDINLELFQRTSDIKLNLVLLNLFMPMLIAIMVYLGIQIAYSLLIKFTNIKVSELFVKTCKDRISVVSLKVVVGIHLSSIALATGFTITHSEISNVLGKAWVLCSTLSIPVMVVYVIIFITLYLTSRHNNKVKLETEN